jgi:hypothetical protein
MSEDIETAFKNIRDAMKKEGQQSAGQVALVAAFEMLCIDMRRTADLLEEARGRPEPQPAQTRMPANKL